MAASPEGQTDGDGQPGDDESAQSTSLPLSMFGAKPPKEGDMIGLKVISVDQQGGAVNVALAGEMPAGGQSGPGAPGTPPSQPGSAGLANQLDNKKAM